MTGDTATELEPSIAELEAAIRRLSEPSGNSVDMGDARRNLSNVIVEACHLPQICDEENLSELVQKAATSTAGRREAAVLVLRALAVDGLLPFETDHRLERCVVDLIEAGFQDQLRRYNFSKKTQTFEKIEALRGHHEVMCLNLRSFVSVGATLADIVSHTPDLLKAVKNGALGPYLAPFRWHIIKSKINQICTQATILNLCNDSTYKQLFRELESSCDALNSECELLPSFLTYDYVVPFVKSVNEALRTLKAGSTEKFTCHLEPRRSVPTIAAKKYPLHIVDKWLTINLPFVNKGPGMAIDVEIEFDVGIDCGLALEEDVLRLGDVPPGDFAISFRGVVVSPMSSVQITLQLTWGELFGESKSIVIDAVIMGQDKNVDWYALELLEPYSLEVAGGDRFVGRSSKVQEIGNRLLRSQMSSTYITGQKRIGKTSLAKAVLRHVVNSNSSMQYRTLYLEWGEYSNADPTRSVQSLGENLYDFLVEYLPFTVVRPPRDFAGSLSPLNSVARLLEQHCPNDRFVFVLDEFDEIHPEMYRHGPLAEAFFANLRTLSSKRNFAFILVGGEKMPFIIGAQGDQLNKFFRVPLDYFSRSDEWEDYMELVTGPVRGQLNWHDSSLSELFNCTAGHPYYTMFICSKIFSNAVTERDTEIIASDVRRALNQRLSELDTNAFAHFWKDGISEEREQAEVIELKRLRVLVAFGRAMRLGVVNRETIQSTLGGLNLDPSAVGPIVDDFLRRDVFRDTDSELSTSLPLFQRWIADVGLNKLISSTLADDIEGALQKANEVAYVQAAELIKLVDSWPLYRGREISSESVRGWLDQVTNSQDQRLLFKLLSHLHFVTPVQISDLLRQAHERLVIRVAPPFRGGSKAEKRRDILVTYVDGPGKSGASFARNYAKESGVLLDCVIEPSKIARRISDEKERPSTIVIVDDLAGTGQTIATALSNFLKPITDRLQATSTPVLVLLLYATESAETKIRRLIQQFSQIRIELYVGVILGDESRAFLNDSPGFWKDEDERDRAKALCIRLGAGLYKDALGYGGQGLLLSFPDGCPNNNLPILFASRSGMQPWNALLARPVS